MHPTEETKEQFMERYAAHSKRPDIFEDEMIALPCDCKDGGGPTHWAALSRGDLGLIRDHLDYYAPRGTPWPEGVEAKPTGAAKTEEKPMTISDDLRAEAGAQDSAASGDSGGDSEVLRRAAAEIERSERWAGYCCSCALSAEIPESRSQFEERMEAIAKEEKPMTVAIEEGPKLNRAVAEVIGWKWWVVKGEPNRLIGLYEAVPREAVEVGPYDPAISAKILPRYSTDLNAAWAAAEKVFPHGFIISVGGGFPCFCAPRTGPNEAYDPAQNRKREGRGDTVARAICMAILKLKGEEVIPKPKEPMESHGITWDPATIKELL